MASLSGAYLVTIQERDAEIEKLRHALGKIKYIGLAAKPIEAAVNIAMEALGDNHD